MKVLITGANGFLGKNLSVHLAERKDVEVVCFTRDNVPSELSLLLRDIDFIFHLAGINRPTDPQDFETGNAALTHTLCCAIATCERMIPVIYTSSTQAIKDNQYGLSKRNAEKALFNLQYNKGIPVHVFRLPNVFGKWCRPDYNSAVATFCHNISRNLPVVINDPTATLTLVYVDDVINRFIQLMDGSDSALDSDGFEVLNPQYTTTVGELVRLIQVFRDSRSSMMTERVGTGFIRSLYSTYLSYLPKESFAYKIPRHEDSRGVFVEMLKTPDCGQFSFFTAHPGITRGGHYHHSKTEKFLVISGQARYRFRHIFTGETYELDTSGDKAEIVETVPGWTHDITNTGSVEMVVLLWANEVFDRNRPDTVVSPL